MSVLLVTDDSDDDIEIPKYEHIYQQIKELKYNSSSIESSLSIVHQNSQSIHHRRRSRPQQCLVKYLFTYMLTLLLLTNHLHWSIIFLSLSSIKFMSTYASTSTSKLTSSIIKDNQQQCLAINSSYVDRICSKTCHRQKYLLENFNNIQQLLLDSYYLPFCSNHILNHSINQTNISLSELTENQCRQIFTQLIKYDEEAQKASILFATYMQAIDSASDENRYSIIISDCQQAYRTWACAVKIPYYHRNRLIPPCQTICDEVERVCPTFRPSDREPLFAGQPLFFCNGGIVTNSDYSQRPYCFDTCHLVDGLSQHHSVSSSPEKSSHGTTEKCFEIEFLSPSLSEQFSSSLSSIDNSIFNHTSNASISASAISIISSTWSSIHVTIIIVLLLRIL